MKIRFTGCGNRGQEHTFDFRPWYGRFYLGSPPYRLLREKGGHPRFTRHTGTLDIG